MAALPISYDYGLGSYNGIVNYNVNPCISVAMLFEDYGILLM